MSKNSDRESNDRAEGRRLSKRDDLSFLAFIAGLVFCFVGLLSLGLAETAKYPVMIFAFGLASLLASLLKNPKQFKAMFINRSVKYGSIALYQAIIFFGILVCINIYAQLHPYTKDMTDVGFYTLAEQTKKVFSNLEQEVKALAFFQAADEMTGHKVRMEELLSRCERVSKGKFSFEFIDPDRNPSVAKDHKVSRPRTTVFKCGKNETKISKTSEEAIINAIIKITRSEKKKIYTLSGHGEADIKSKGANGFKRAVDEMRGNQYEVVELHLHQEERVPEDAHIIVLAGPQKELLEKEVEMIESFLDDGGKMVVLIDPYIDSKLDPLLEEWGVNLGQDTVVDVSSKSRMVGGGEVVMPLVNRYGKHEITKDFNLITMFPLVRSVKPNKKVKSLISNPIIFTSKQSWSEKDREEIRFTPGVDDRGPIPLGVAVRERSDDDSDEARLVVIGDSDFASNRYYDRIGNGNLFQNCVNWVAQESDLISIEAKTLKNTPLSLTQKDLLAIAAICLV